MGTTKIGIITKAQIHKAVKKANREIGLENQTGFVSTHKVHKTKKEYNRKNKHKNGKN